MDPITLIVGGALVVFGHVSGRIGYLRRRRRLEEPKPICGCRHHHAYHHPETGECSAVANTHYANGNFREVLCTCKQYSGPIPIESYTSSIEA
jgi:sterol desaturase/sphingolipid hydroxylase (fatty acid hydroxylase superfamily)